MKIYLGIELGSTRIKAVAADEKFAIVSKGEYGWKSEFKKGIWTYGLDEAWRGLKSALRDALKNIDTVSAVGISGMMHGYLAFDKDWNLLAPFATWQNTVTADAAKILSEKFGFNVPQRWSAAHLYQRVLDGEKHVKQVAHLTTLAGYIHFMLTGENVVGIGEASGMFPIDGTIKNYDRKMARDFDELLRAGGVEKSILELLPKVKVAGEAAGTLRNSELLDGLLPVNIPFAPPEGDMQTGMIATNSVAVGTGNISAGTCFNLTVVTGKKLKKVYPEIDIINTPAGREAALIHTNNGTNDINAWFGVLKETAHLFGGNTEELYTKLFEHSLKGDDDCGGVTVYNYMAGEAITRVDSGKPIVVRQPSCSFTLANFIRAQLFGSMATLKLGVGLLAEEEIEIKKITGHGGFFKTARVAQKYMAAAFGAPIYCNYSAGEGGPYGMALLAAYLGNGKSLEEFLDGVFTDGGTAVYPDKRTQEGFNAYMQNFRNGLKMQKI